MVLSLILWGLSGVLSAYQVLAAAWLIKALPAHRRGSIIGVIGSGLITIQGLGILGIGVVADYLGAPAAVAVAGAVGSVLAVPLSIAWIRVPANRGGQYAPRHRHLADSLTAESLRAKSSRVEPRDATH
jgi:MFS family permease